MGTRCQQAVAQDSRAHYPLPRHIQPVLPPETQSPPGKPQVAALLHWAEQQPPNGRTRGSCVCWSQLSLLTPVTNSRAFITIVLKNTCMYLGPCAFVAHCTCMCVNSMLSLTARDQKMWWPQFSLGAVRDADAPNVAAIRLAKQCQETTLPTPFPQVGFSDLMNQSDPNFAWPEPTVYSALIIYSIYVTHCTLRPIYPETNASLWT